MTIPSQGEARSGQPATVISVADGDTINIRLQDGHTETVRLLDVDTPETVHPSKPVECGGPEASAYTKARLCQNESGKNCNTSIQYLSIGRDKYQRVLGYIWIDGQLLNQELVERGLATHNNYGKENHYTNQIAHAEQTARAAGLGLWSMCN